MSRPAGVEPPQKRRRSSRLTRSGSTSNGEGESSSQDRSPPVSTSAHASSSHTALVHSQALSSATRILRPSIIDDHVAPTSPRSKLLSTHVGEELQVAPEGPPGQSSSGREAGILQYLESSPDAYKLGGSDFNCPICFDIIKEAFSTPCGHSYCYKCISSSIRMHKRCPMCNETMASVACLIPNVMLNDIVHKYLKQQKFEDHQSTEIPSFRGAELMKDLESIGTAEQKAIVSILTQSIQGKEKQKKIEGIQNQVCFLEDCYKRTSEEIKVLQDQSECVMKDIKTLKMKITEEQKVELIDDSQPGPSSQWSTEQRFSLPDTNGEKVTTNHEQTPEVKYRVQMHFDELYSNYVSARMPPINEKQQTRTLEEWGESFTRMNVFNTFKEIGTLQYGDPAQGPSIVSSIDFDKDQEFFAVGGVTRQLKVYDYLSVISRPVNVHYPVQDLTCNSKISSVCFNYFLKSSVASCDYDGTVGVSDVHTGTHVRQWKEHEKRCWSVHFNHCDPKIIASGSDDFKVKLWITTMPYSAGGITAEANVCSVRFHPISRFHLAFGCADHKLHYYDVRDLRAPLCVLEGHEKAVSYCQFINHKELVSLSTDSEMRLWDVTTGRCLKTFRGHRNDKNFVGLSVNPKYNYIACGSENNSFYCYYKDVSKHILSYRFNVSRSMLSGTSEPPENPDTQFVSAVCWKPKSSVLLAANSQGYIKILELTD